MPAASAMSLREHRAPYTAAPLHPMRNDRRHTTRRGRDSRRRNRAARGAPSPSRRMRCRRPFTKKRIS